MRVSLRKRQTILKRTRTDAANISLPYNIINNKIDDFSDIMKNMSSNSIVKLSRAERELETKKTIYCECRKMTNFIKHAYSVCNISGFNGRLQFFYSCFEKLKNIFIINMYYDLYFRNKYTL